MNKPKNVVTTKEDKFASRIVTDLLPKQFFHLNPCGRLDKDTTGLLLLTNDGELIYRLTHPRFEIKKTYFVKIKGQLNNIEKQSLEKGVVIDGKKTGLAKIKIINSFKDVTSLNIEIREGRKRQVRRMFLAVNHPVTELKRIREGSLELGNLGPGQWRFLNKDEIKQLYEETGLNN
ncbi:MAG: pseudouridine synthase [Candidatus Omnitrophota bacterium]